MFGFGPMSGWYGEDLETGRGRGGGGGGGGGDDNGCGIVIMLFFGCLLLSTMCNNSRVNENYINSANPQVEIVEEKSKISTEHGK